MAWGSHLKYLEALRDDMGIMPLGLANRPDVHDLGEPAYRAFCMLSSSRQQGMDGPLAISISDMAAYCQIFEIGDVDERQSFVVMMQKLDAAYLAAVAARNDTQTKSEVVTPPAGADNLRKG